MYRGDGDRNAWCTVVTLINHGDGDHAGMLTNHGIDTLTFRCTPCWFNDLIALATRPFDAMLLITLYFPLPIAPPLRTTIISFTAVGMTLELLIIIISAFAILYNYYFLHFTYTIFFQYRSKNYRKLCDLFQSTVPLTHQLLNSS